MSAGSFWYVRGFFLVCPRALLSVSAERRRRTKTDSGNLSLPKFLKNRKIVNPSVDVPKRTWANFLFRKVKKNCFFLYVRGFVFICPRARWLTDGKYCESLFIWPGFFLICRRARFLLYIRIVLYIYIYICTFQYSISYHATVNSTNNISIDSNESCGTSFPKGSNIVKGFGDRCLNSWYLFNLPQNIFSQARPCDEPLPSLLSLGGTGSNWCFT